MALRTTTAAGASDGNNQMRACADHPLAGKHRLRQLRNTHSDYDRGLGTSGRRHLPVVTVSHCWSDTGRSRCDPTGCDEEEDDDRGWRLVREGRTTARFANCNCSSFSDPSQAAGDCRSFSLSFRTRQHEHQLNQTVCVRVSEGAVLLRHWSQKSLVTDHQIELHTVVPSLTSRPHHRHLMSH